MQNNNTLELNSLQKAYWFGRENEIEWGGVSCQAVFEIRMKDLDIHKFKESLKILISIHPMLSMVVKGNMYIEKNETADIPLEVCDFSNEVDATKLIADLRKQMKYEKVQEGQRLFDIKVIKSAHNQFSILIKLDMIMCDLGSMHIFFRDLSLAYEGKELSKSDYTVEDYIQQLNEYEMTEEYKKHVEYWEKKIDTFPQAPGFPVNLTKNITEEELISRREICISDARWKQFCKKVNSVGVSPSIAILYLYSLIISAWGGGSSFAISVTVADRKRFHKAVANMIGEFTKVLLFPAEIEDRSNKENAKGMQNTFWETIEHISYDATKFRKLIYEKTGESRLYPFVFTSALGVGVKADNGSFQENIAWVESTTPQVILDHQIFPYSDGVILAWDCRESVFLPGVLDQMFSKYEEMVNQSIDEEDFWERRMMDFRVEQSINIQNELNGQIKEFELTMMHEKIWEVASKQPEKCAIIYKKKEYTYHQLVTTAENVAALLKSESISSGTRIMVAMENGFEAIATILGILGYGCSYVPVLYNLPTERLQYIYNKAEASAIFLSTQNQELKECKVLLFKDIKKENFDIVRGKIQSEAYAIFTSGSTGEPKGVMITHQSAMNTILEVNEQNIVTDQDRAIALSSLSFDLSVYDMFGLLCVGGSMVIPTEEEKIDAGLIDILCEENSVTLWNTVPKYFEIYIDYLINQEKENHDIRKIFLSGDWIPLRLVNLIKKYCAKAKFVSMGGATEAAIWSNYYVVNELNESWKSIPYGYPLANQKFYVLDELGRPCPDYVSGLLHISGEGLALGYVNAPDITEKVFYEHEHLGERLYNTGDYGRYDSAGVIEFLGRKDDQIKINGYRIELGEIENAFNRSGIEECVILPIGEKMDSRKLVAFVKGTLDTSILYKKIEGILPRYAIPESIIGVDEFPKTINNKIDNKQLIKMLDGEKNVNITSEGGEIVNIILETFHIKTVDIKNSFSDLGVSSMELIEFANKLDKHFGHRPTVGEMMQYNSLEQLIQYYAGAEKEKQTELLDKEVSNINDKDFSEMIKTISYRKIKEWIERDRFGDDSYKEMLTKELATRKITQTGDNALLSFLEAELDLEDIQVTDNFFKLGVSSVEIMQIANRLDKIYGKRPSVNELMSYDTLQELVDFYQGCTMSMDNSPEKKLDKGLNHHENLHVKKLIEQCTEKGINIWQEDGRLKYRIRKKDVDKSILLELNLYKQEVIEYLSQKSGMISSGKFATTPIQLAYILGREDNFELGNINAHYYMEFRCGELELKKLEIALNKVINKNPALRTIINSDGTQQVLEEIPHYAIAFEKVNAEKEFEDLRGRWSHHTYELDKWPMFTLFVSEKEELHTIHLSFDCILLDGWSVRMFMEQVMGEYYDIMPKYAEYTFQEYIFQEKEWLNENIDNSVAIEYWEKHIQTIPLAPILKYKQNFADIKEPQFKRLGFVLDSKSIEILTYKAKKNKLTLSLVICATYMKVLSKWSENKDCTINITLFNRYPINEEINYVLGEFTNITLLSYYGSENNKMLDNMSKLQEQLWKHIEYRTCEGISLLRKIKKSRVGEAVMPVVFTSMLAGEASENRPLDKITQTYALSQTPQVVLDHQIHIQNGMLFFSWDYIEQAFHSKDIAAMFEDYEKEINVLVNEDWDLVR